MSSEESAAQSLYVVRHSLMDLWGYMYDFKVQPWRDMVQETSEFMGLHPLEVLHRLMASGTDGDPSFLIAAALDVMEGVISEEESS